jgi:hypothetical protein
MVVLLCQRQRGTDLAGFLLSLDRTLVAGFGFATLR